MVSENVEIIDRVDQSVLLSSELDAAIFRCDTEALLDLIDTLDAVTEVGLTAKVYIARATIEGLMRSKLNDMRRRLGTE